MRKTAVAVVIALFFVTSSVSPVVVLRTETATADNVPNFEPQSSDWWDSDWAWKKNITLNSSQVPSTLTNFPVLINLTDGDLRDDAQSDGDDIAFTNDAEDTQLNHEIELYDNTTGQLIVWVNVTSLDSSSNTSIFMYYGNAGASNQESINDTWDSNYLSVHHLEENDFDGNTGDVEDSTSNDCDLTTDHMAVGDRVQGIAGYCFDFDGSNDHVYAVPFSGTVDDTIYAKRASNNPHTIEAWAKSDTSSGERCIVGRFDDYWWEDYGVGLYHDGSNIRVQCEYDHSNHILSDSTTTTNWNYYAGVTHTSNGKLYENGVLVNSGDLNGGYTYRFNIGAQEHRGGTTTREFNGKIDEVRTSNIERNSSWITTTYNTIRGAFDGGFFSMGTKEPIEWQEAQPPTEFAATTYNHTQIDLSWKKGDMAQNTLIRYLEGNTAPADRTQGMMAYNDTGSDTSITTLNPKTTYSFSAWSWNEECGYNETYASDSNTTDKEPVFFDNGFEFRKKITINQSQVAGDLTNFPVCINITDSDLANNTQADGDDIVFVSAGHTTQYHHEIEHYNRSNGQLVAWVNVTGLSSSSDTILYMYYGNADANNQENAANVWNKYNLVYHMKDITTSTVEDSAGNNDGTKGSSSNPEEITSFIYKGQEFDSTNPGYINTGMTITEDSDITFEVYYKLYSFEGGDGLQVGNCNIQSYTTVRGVGFSNERYSSSDGQPQGSNNTAFQLITSKYNAGIIAYNPPLNEYHHAVGTYDGSNIKLYVNGSLVDSKSYSSGWTDDYTYRIGRTFCDHKEGYNRYTDGVIDEVRILDEALNSSWIATSHNTIRNASDGSFFSIGIEEYPLFITDENPANNSNEVTGLLDGWSCNVSSAENTSGTIECNNGDTMSWTDETEGTQTLTFSDWLEYNTTYTIWVNVSSGTQTVSEIFNFTTTTCKITGTIINEFWGGVPDIKVVANSTTNEYTTYTDSNGYYEFEGIAYGSSVNYNITASKFAYKFYADDGKQYIVENLERNVSDVNFTGVHYFFEGNGTVDEPFTIRNCTHLDNIRLFLNYTFVLHKDIDMAACNVSEWNGGKGFEPIGNSSDPFTGTFDGGAYVIENLYSNFSNRDYGGLFGCVENSDIRNLGLKQINISGGDYVGSLAGYMNNTSILRVFTSSNKSISGTNYAGGLVGYFANGTIDNAYARVNTTGTTYGGMIGSAVDSTINVSYATGDVTGGGGLIGSQSGSTINNSYFDNQTSGTTTSDGGIGKNTSDMTSQGFWDTTNFSFPDTWFIDENQNDQYPILSIFTEITPPLLREVNYAGSKSQQLHRYLNSSFNPEEYCFFNVTAFVPEERYIGRWNKNVSDKYFIATGDRTEAPDYNDTQNNYIVSSRFTSEYTGYYEQIRVFTVWHGMYPAHLGAAVYTDDNGQPGELLGYTEPYTIQEGRDEIWFPDTAHVWISMNLTEPVFMAKDTNYWLVATSNDSSMWRESKYGDYNLSTYSDFSWLLGRADGESTDNVKRLAYNVTLEIPDKEYVDPYAGTAYEGDYAYWKADVWNATFDWPADLGAESWQQGVDSMTTELNESAEPVPLTELLIYATTSVDVSPVEITQVEMTWGTGQGDAVVWDDPINMSRVSPDLNYWTYNKTNLPGGDWNTWKMTLYDEFGNVESYDYYRYLKHGITERITFQVNAANPSESDPFKEITSETNLYSREWVSYLYEADYDDTMYIYGDNEGRKQVLRHEQGVDGSSTDSGYWRTEEPTDEFHERTCAFFVGGAWDTNVVIPEDVTIENAVLVWWLASGRQIEGSYWAPPYNEVGTNFHWGRSDTEASYDEFYIRDLGFGEWRQTMYDAKEDTLAWQTFPQTRRYLNDWINFEEDTWYGSDTPYMNNSTGRLTNYMGRQMVGKVNFSSLSGTDYPNTFDSNSIYQLFMGMDYDAMWSSGPNAAIFNNRSHPSFVMFNVPDDDELQTTDSNNDGINDYEKIYCYGLHPFWNDTDNDGFTDIQELSRQKGANLYRDYPTDSNIILLKNMTPLIGNDTEEWTKTLSIDIEHPEGRDMNVEWYILRNFTFNDSYINQDQLLEGEWELVQTNASVSDGTYTAQYEPAAGENYWAVNVSDSSGWWGNRSSVLSGPGRQISGTITENGTPLHEIEVTVELNGDIHTTYTNEEGMYYVENLTAGDYTVTPSSEGSFFIPKNRTIRISTENETANFETIEAPLQSEEYPFTYSKEVNTTVNWSILITADYAFNWTLSCSDSNSSSGTEDTTGRKNISLSDLEYGEWYSVQVNASHENYSHVQSSEIYSFKVRDNKTAYPGKPIAFTATAESPEQIQISWTKGNDADRTHVRYDVGNTPPSNRDRGQEAYEGTGTAANISGLDMDTPYSVSAWSYNSTYDSWSYLAYDRTQTLSNYPVVLSDPSPANNSEDNGLEVMWDIMMEDQDMDLFNWTIECSNGQSNSSNDDMDGKKQVSLTSLDYNTTYTVWVNATDTIQTVEEWFVFKTVDVSSLNISITPTTADLGIIDTNASAMTTGNYFNITNNGIDANISASVSNSQNWTFGNYSERGHDVFCVNWSTDGWQSEDNIKIGGTNIANNLRYHEWHIFDIKLLSPSSLSKTSEGEEFTITLTATPG